MGGQGTFDRIWGNLVAARELSQAFEVRVRLHLDPESYEAIPRFLDEYRQTFGHDRRFHLILRPIMHLGGPGDQEIPIFESDDAREAVEEMGRQARLRGLSIAGREASAEEPFDACYAARANSLIIRADGSLAKCTTSLAHPENRVGRLLEDGKVELDAVKMARWMRGIWSGERGELECPMRGYADGSQDDERPIVRWQTASG
jgi:uncharacterized protein